MPGERVPGWEDRAVFLGGARPEATIAALEREGWELRHVTTPHHGALTLIGYFRRPMARAPERDDPPPGHRAGTRSGSAPSVPSAR